MDARAWIVLVTVGNVESARQLARQLVEERLAACAQVLPGGTAIYRWQGQLYEDAQVQLIIKTAASSWDGLRDRIVQLHADEVPEILALPVVDGLPAYLAWLNASVAAPGSA